MEATENLILSGQIRGFCGKNECLGLCGTGVRRRIAYSTTHTTAIQTGKRCAALNHSQTP